MTYKTFSVGEVMTSPNANILSHATVSVVTSATRPTLAAGDAGTPIYETDTGKVYIWSGTAWVEWFDDGALTAWVPQVTQTAAITETVEYAKYRQTGKWVEAYARLTMTTAGTATAAILSTLPVTALNLRATVGTFWFEDNSTGIFHSGIAVVDTADATKIGFYRDQDTGRFGTTVTIANADELRFNIAYEAA